jgi:hypothetical protein
MNIGDYLLKANKITQKQREKAELEHEVTGNKFGKCCLDLGYITRTELNQALKALKRKEDKVMPTEIGEGSKFTFDLKFLVTIGAVIVSACATYFSITGKLNEIESSNSPNRMEYDYVVGEISSLKSAGDLKIISYKLEQYDEMFEEIKELVRQLSPLASDLEYIKKELGKLKDKEVDIPEIDLSGIETKLDNLSSSIQAFEKRLNKLEKSKPGGRF